MRLVVQSGQIGRLIMRVQWAQLPAQPTIVQIRELDTTLSDADADRLGQASTASASHTCRQRPDSTCLPAARRCCASCS